MFIDSAKTPEREGSISHHIQLLWAISRLLIASVSPLYLVDEFHFFSCCSFPSDLHITGWRNLVRVECL